MGRRLGVGDRDLVALNALAPPEFLYHRSNALYAPGDRIMPGNWGRLVLGIGASHPSFFREHLWERMRQSHYPDLPSRMTAGYAFEQVSRAERFTQNPAWQTYTYLVAIADPSLPTHRADMGWVDLVVGYHEFEAVERVVHHYWAGDEQSPDGWEWLTAGELLVRQRLTAIPSNGDLTR